jgi:hypothetical protein
MYDLNAREFVRLQTRLSQIATFMQAIFQTGHQTLPAHLEKQSSPMTADEMDGFQHDLTSLGLTSSLALFGRLRRLFESGHCHDEWYRDDLMRQLADLNSRIIDELSNSKVLALSQEEIRYYGASEPIFGADVERVFPLAARDISEAAKCLGLTRSVAAVFHLMRVMESAVQALASKLGITNVSREWGKLLSDIAEKIEDMPKGPPRNEWSESHTHLYHVKQAWRNDTMHPNTNYTFDEAKNIFEAVKTFTKHLTRLI